MSTLVGQTAVTVPFLTDKPVKTQVVCPKNGTAALAGLNKALTLEGMLASSPNPPPKTPRPRGSSVEGVLFVPE